MFLEQRGQGERSLLQMTSYTELYSLYRFLLLPPRFSDCRHARLYRYCAGIAQHRIPVTITNEIYIAKKKKIAEKERIKKKIHDRAVNK